MTTFRPRRARLAAPVLLALLTAFTLVPSAGARSAGPAAVPAAPQGPPAAAAPSAADGREADALRDALWDLERHLRHRLAAAGRSDRVTAFQPPRTIARLTARLHGLRRAARTLAEPAATELARKAAALRPLLAEVERSERSGVSGGGSAWNPAGRASATWVDAAAHGACRDARSAGDGVLAADTAGVGAGGELWLRYTAAAGGYVVLDSAGSRIDTVIEVYDACPSAGGTRIAGGDDETGLQARAAFRAAAGETRWLRVGGWQGAAGSLVLEIEGGGLSGIAGVVTRESTGQGLFRDVEVWDAGGSFVTSIKTEFDGFYVVFGLTPGTYFATTNTFFSGEGLIDELYDDLLCPGGAPSGCDPTSGTPIVVPPDDIVTGIDFALGEGARVAGRLRDAATGLPLTSVDVEVFDQDGDLIGEDSTDVAGRYLITGLGPGLVFARGGDFSGTYQRELYDDIPCQGSCDPTTGTPVPVAIGTTTSGIDFDLDRLGSIAGTVTHAVGGAPVPFADLRVFDDQGVVVAFLSADAQGEYETGGLVAGTYFVATDTFGEYLDELYDDLPCFPSCDPTTGTPVPVTLGQVTAGIDFALNRLGRISGTVTDAVSGLPLSFFIAVFDSGGSFVASDFGFGGAYIVDGLTTGTYFVTAEEDLYRAELYDDLPCSGGAPGGCDPTTGTPVAVQIDAVTADIDFALTPLGSIAGMVTASDTGLPLDNFSVQVWDSAGQIVASDFAFGGDYEIFGLESGTYFVTVQQSQHVGELYDDLPCPDGPPGGCDPTTGTPVPVSLGTTTGGIDFALDPEGSVSGTVRDAQTAAPIGFAEVQVFDDAGFFVDNGFANAVGHYQVSGLETGSYYIIASADGHSAQLYDGLPCPGALCDPTVGTPVPVSAGSETGGIDFDLPRAGSISGTVSSSLGGPLGSADVTLYDTDGNFHAFDFTDSAGDYFFEVEAGTWFVVAERFTDYAGVLYDGIPCPGGSCDPTTGTPVPVVVGGGTTGIDFVLPPARGITGTVTDSAGNPLPGVAIDVWNASGNLVTTGVTGPLGGYLVNPGAGTYFVSTDNGLGATDEVYDDVPCPLGPAHEGLCDPVTGEPVVLNFDSLATGIDFELSGITVFADGFESGDTSAWSGTVE